MNRMSIPVNDTTRVCLEFLHLHVLDQQGQPVRGSLTRQEAFLQSFGYHQIILILAQKALTLSPLQVTRKRHLPKELGGD